jgi:hypothetical protein
MTLTTSGNLGVGTVSPAEKLEVSGNIAYTKNSSRKIYIVNETAMNNAGGFDLTVKASDHSSNSTAVKGGNLYLTAGSGFNWNQVPAGGFLYIQSGANTTGASSGYRNGGDIIFMTGGANSSSNEQMRITESGKIGIGKNSPAYTLDISGDMNLIGALRVNSSAGTSGQVLTADGSGGVSWSALPSANVFTSNPITLSNASTNNDLNIGSGTFIKISGPTSAVTVTGLSGGVDGKMIVLYNTTGANMTIKNQSSSSLAANRVITGTGSDLVTTADGSVALIYDGSQSRWIVRSFQP